MRVRMLPLLASVVIAVSLNPAGVKAHDASIRHILNTEKVLAVTTRVGFMTILEFPSTVDEVYCGASELFSVEVVGRRVAVKALAPGARTNLIASIGTNKRYVFELMESSTEPADYLITLIDPERGLNFPALLEATNKGLDGESSVITELNRRYDVEMDGSHLRFAVIRLLRDTRKDISVIWWRLFNSFKKVDERRVFIEGQTRIAVLADFPGREELFFRNYRDFLIVVSGMRLSDQFTLVLPWDDGNISVPVTREAAQSYQPNDRTVPSRRFRVWVDSFVDQSTGKDVEVPGHFDHFEAVNYMERGVME